jgi:hypothetical protein
MHPDQPRRWTRLAGRLAAGAATALIAACGLEVRSADLFLLTRTGAGSRLTLLVNDSGTVSCDGAKPVMLASAQLITARDLTDSLAAPATAKLTIPDLPGSVYYYRVRLQQGTVAFPDRAGGTHRTLAELELFGQQVAQDDCHLGG